MDPLKRCALPIGLAKAGCFCFASFLCSNFLNAPTIFQINIPCRNIMRRKWTAVLESILRDFEQFIRRARFNDGFTITRIGGGNWVLVPLLPSVRAAD